jgi:predicted metal-binding protein
MKTTKMILAITLAMLFLATLPACAKVGSERWCKKMQEKSAADWTASESKDYAKHCVLK